MGTLTTCLGWLHWGPLNTCAGKLQLQWIAREVGSFDLSPSSSFFDVQSQILSPNSFSALTMDPKFMVWTQCSCANFVFHSVILVTRKYLGEWYWSDPTNNGGTRKTTVKTLSIRSKAWLERWKFPASTEFWALKFQKLSLSFLHTDTGLSCNCTLTVHIHLAKSSHFRKLDD